VRWAMRREQQSNRRTNVLVTLNGKTKPVTTWSRDFGLSRYTVHSRINTLKWCYVCALTLPSGRLGKVNCTHRRKK
jgi:hypothetical protein